ncbi:MAG: transglycosylase domain-containing protein [Actinobacteria bacterium]|nr:transglycosylase domain-containing protein [Actinomycetota bacterium]
MTRRERQRRRRRRHASPLRRTLIVVATLLVIAAAGGGIALAGWVVHVLQDTPNIQDLRPKPQGAISTVYAADGTRLGFISSDTLRSAIPGSQIPLVMKRATVAIEDKRFYKHGGVDPVGLLRAAVKNVTSDTTQQGGSTLTMQLVRNLYTPDTRFTKTFKRKIREAKLAEQLESEHSKEWILVAYLNNVPYGTVGGQTAVGVQAAARIFFNKPASALTLSQAALLAGLPQAPSQYNPFNNPSGARKRRGEVLKAMVAAGYVTQGEAAAANAAPLGVHRSDYYAHRREQFFFDYVRSELIRRYGRRVVEQGGLKVYTTINLRFQELARQAIQSHVGYPGAPSAALATVDPTNGHILAMASSAQYGPTVFNYAAQSHRQPGSTFKVIDLMAAVREGVDPNTTYYVSRHLTPGWLPQEPTWEVQTDSHSYAGSISLARALPASDNTVFAQLGADLGPEKVRQAAYDMGITSHLDAYYAEAIGGLTYGVSPLEMADAYATVADGGWRNTVTAIAKVVHPDGTVDDLGRPRRVKKFTDGEAYEILPAMKAVLVSGTAAGQGIGCPSAGKTGTTSNNTDAWFVGITPRLSTAVWVGYPNESTTLGSSVFGGTIAAPIWHDFMTVAKGSYCDDWPAPTEAFHAQPFFGTYASAHGSSSDTSSTSGTSTTPTTTTPTTTTPGGTNTGPYAHPPQTAPQTPPPAGGGNGGNGNGHSPPGQSQGGGAGAPAR